MGAHVCYSFKVVKMAARRKFTAKFELIVIKTAEETKNSEASQQHGVNEKQVRVWRKQKDKLSVMPKNKCADHGRECFWPDLDEAINEWVLNQRKSGFIVMRNMIRIAALRM